MKVIGEIVVFKNEKGLYSTTISNKKEDGTYENMYITVNFKKGTEIENKTKIEVRDGFLSFYKTKDGLLKVKLVITAFRTAEDKEKEEEQYAKEERFAIQNEDEADMDLPF